MDPTSARRYPPGALRVGPGDVGSRVSLRRALAEGGFSDTVGDLLRYDADTAVVRNRHGEDIVLRVADLVAGRVVVGAG